MFIIAYQCSCRCITVITMKLKKILCWPPLLAGVGAGVTILILGYITYESIISDTNYGLWLFASFGSSVVLVFGYPNNDFAQPKNIFFGHLLTSFVGIFFLTFFEVNFITIGLAVGIATMLMIFLKITHPPAGGNPIAVMIGGVSFQFLVFPVMVGTITIIIGGIIYNSLILKRKYPVSWK
jgi:CBS-domain-containing membrane protein